jgi:serine protease
MLDTRDGTGGFHAPVTSNETTGLPVAGVGPVLAYTKSVVLNVTVVDATADSYLTVFPGVRSSTSNLNFWPGQVTQVQVIVPIGPDGRVDFSNHVGSVDVVADVFGYFA